MTNPARRGPSPSSSSIQNAWERRAEIGQSAQRAKRWWSFSATGIMALILLAEPMGRARDLSFEPATSGPHPRILTLEDRIKAEEAIQKVYFSHQTDVSLPFEQAVPREVLERRVRTYLKQTVALERTWHIRVSADALRQRLDPYLQR